MANLRLAQVEDAEETPPKSQSKTEKSTNEQLKENKAIREQEKANIA